MNLKFLRFGFRTNYGLGNNSSRGVPSSEIDYKQIEAEDCSELRGYTAPNSGANAIEESQKTGGLEESILDADINAARGVKPL